jgi:hypothetical protein
MGWASWEGSRDRLGPVGVTLEWVERHLENTPADGWSTNATDSTHQNCVTPGERGRGRGWGKLERTVRRVSRPRNHVYTKPTKWSTRKRSPNICMHDEPLPAPTSSPTTPPPPPPVVCSSTPK